MSRSEPSGLSLSDQQRRFFESRGYLRIGQLSTTEEVHALKGEASRLIGMAGESRTTAPEDHLMRSADGHVRVALHLCHISEPFRAHALASPAAYLVRSLFRENAYVLTSLLFNKPAHVGQVLTLHQDLPYYPYLGDDDLVTCWTALDESREDNGCLEYLPGTHRSRVPHRRTGGQQSLDIEPDLVDVADAVTMPLKQGEAVLHHGLTVHRSAVNRSGRSRMGLSTLFVRESAPVSMSDFPYLLLEPGPDPV